MIAKDYKTIPLPDFTFAEVINRKAQQFCRGQLGGPLYTVKQLGDKIQSELWSLNSDGDRIQFLGYAINHVVEVIADHESKCHKEHCRVGADGQEFLYFLYGKLAESGLKIEGDNFTSNEIVENNRTINELGYKLDELKTGEHILYDDIQLVAEQLNEIKTDIAELKNLYVLGKKKWYQQLHGIIFENLANKALDEVMKELAPLLIKFGHEAVKFYLQQGV
jgi:hypothetical protein